MNFREFKNELLVAMVVFAKAQPNKQIDPLDAANSQNLTFREGWLRQAVKSLNDEGLIRTYFTLGGGENGGMTSNITGSGIQEAEDIANDNGYDLYEEIDEAQNSVERSSIQSAPASDRTVKIDHNSSQYTEIIEKLDKAILSARTSNSIRNDDPDTADQRVSELEAGKVLISAPQADKSLVKNLLLPALRWIMEKIADNIVAALIGSLITLIAAYFGLAM